MIANYWPQSFRDLYGGEWPSSYCCVDTETTGYYPGEDLITEWGHCLVEDGEVIDRLSVIINWTNGTALDKEWLHNRLDRVRYHMEQQGRCYHIDYDRMRIEGKAPEKVFSFIRKFTDRIKEKNIPFVLHNHSFDEKMLNAAFTRFFDDDSFTFGDSLIDTEAMAKANQPLHDVRVYPNDSDTLRSYFLRVKHIRASGVYSSLDDYCYNTYGLNKKIKQNEMHSAYTDSFCCHLLMQAFGNLMVKKPLPYPAFTQQNKDMKPVKGGRVRKQRMS